MALHIQIDINYPDHPKLIEAGLEGAGLHTFAICVARRMEGDGWLSRAVLRRLGGSDELIDRLVDLRLFEAGDDGMIRPWGYLDRNPSQGAIAEIRAAKADSAKAGNHKRWGHSGPVDKCRTCNPIPQVVAQCDRTGSQPESHCDPLGSPETETETETETTSSTSSENHSDSEPARPSTPAVDQQELRAVVAAVAKIEAGDRATDGAYVAGIRREILTGPDPDRRDRIQALLDRGHTESTIGDVWVPPSPLDAFGLPTGPTRDPGPDAKRNYELAEARRQDTLAAYAEEPPGDPRAGLAAARAAAGRIEEPTW